MKLVSPAQRRALGKTRSVHSVMSHRGLNSLEAQGGSSERKGGGEGSSHMASWAVGRDSGFHAVSPY